VVCYFAFWCVSISAGDVRRSVGQWLQFARLNLAQLVTMSWWLEAAICESVVYNLSGRVRLDKCVQYTKNCTICM